MKLYAIITLILFLSMLFIPLFSLLGENGDRTDKIVLTTSSSLSQAETESAVFSQTTAATEEEKETISVMLTSTEKIKDMDMSSYLAGCLAAEMPVSYEPEALKAQAVASYTYALYMKKAIREDTQR